MVDCDIVTLPYELEFVTGIPNNLTDPVVDTFSRTESNGWGSADSGQVWGIELGTASHFTVTAGVGRQTHTAVNETHWISLDAGSPNVEVLVALRQALGSAVGASVAHDVIARETDTANNYRVATALTTAGTMTIALSKNVAGTPTTIAAAVTAGTHTAGATWWIRLQVIGSIIRARMWLTTSTEPTTWQVSAIDTSLTTGNKVALRSRFEIGNTNTLPKDIDWDNLAVSRAVGAIQTGEPETLLALHEDPWCVTEGTRFDPPTPRYAEVASMLADGSRYPSIVYNNRVLELRLAVQAANPDELASALQDLARQLHFGLDGTGSNIIRFADKTTESVYFRTFRVSPADIGVIGRNQRTALVSVDVPAEPYAYGPREFYEALTVTNNPATGVANPMYFDLTGVKGDADTPLMLMSTGTAFGQQSIFAVRRRGNPDDMPFALQAELADQLGTNTTLRPFDASMSGSGSNHIRTNLVAVVGTEIPFQYFNLPDTRTVDGRGDYRVIARVRRSNATADIIARTYSAGASLDIDGDPVTIPKDTAIQLVDLGVIGVPIGADPVFDGYSGQQVPVYGQNFGIRLECTSAAAGCGTIDIDYVLLTPADDAWLNVRWSNSGIGNAAESVIDGVHEAVWYRDDQGALLSSEPSPVVGGFPYISPEQTNRIFVVGNVGGTSDDITDTWVFAASYWPRYLDPVRPVTE